MYLFETMRLENGHIPRETYHHKRIERSAHNLAIPFSTIKWQQLIDDIKVTHAQGCYRLKVMLSEAGVLSSELGALTDKPHMTACLVQMADDIPQWQRVNKTSERAFLQHHHQTDLVLFTNEHGKLLEFDIGNFVMEWQGQLCTPRYQNDFLRGCMRQALLDNGEIVEADLTIDALAQAVEQHDKIWMINSLRAWVPVVFSHIDR
ncbi:hypothetical protein TP70_01095 [Staphylococcus microti]|uniref:Aminodeoxychorismate lyase n=1 Tax=Staphylococcus microti TaxID=569857 RepID=A0A0D6XTC4_9STAP|nr:aminotransferase class IV [Staphylococcus microti]KIX91695.1 hypothetical protein TP70_01095 [Staphylococcus microti]PNZ84307.1 aminodeoxychorismate lyase [Staphylococcus microti]SUM56797.1 aminodeoxychorismate lyase [Staphylococcus microti]